MIPVLVIGTMRSVSAHKKVDYTDRYLRLFANYFSLPLFAVDVRGRMRPLNRSAADCTDRDDHGPLAELLGRDGCRLPERVRCFLREIGRTNSNGVAIRRIHAGTEGKAVDLVVLLPEDDGSEALLMILDAANHAPLDAEVLMRWFGLTAREAEVVARVATGHSLKAVASELGISAGTARNHLKAAFQKTGISGQTRLAALVGILGPFLRSRDIGPAGPHLSQSGHAVKAEEH